MAPYLAFLHHVAAFIVFAALLLEFVLLRNALTLRSARQLQLADLAYGIAAASVLVIGVLRVMHYEKGADYYLGNSAFWVKMAAFALVGLVSIIPTVEFLSWSKALKAQRIPEPSPQKQRLLQRLIHLELIGIIVILLAAALMAKGVG